MKYFYDKEDIQNYKTDDIPLGVTVIIKTKKDMYKGKLTLNNKDCIAIDKPKELKGTYLSRDCVESIRVIIGNLFNIYKKRNGNKMDKQRLLREIEEFKRQQNELSEKMEWLQEQIKKENNKKEWWIPECGEEYFYVDSCKDVINEKYSNYHFAKERINNLNYFKTKKEAERVAFEELLHRKLQRFSFNNNKNNINECGIFKYYICYNIQDSILETYCESRVKEYGCIYFSSEDIAKKAIEEFKDDLLRYFTSNK